LQSRQRRFVAVYGFFADPVKDRRQQFQWLNETPSGVGAHRPATLDELSADGGFFPLNGKSTGPTAPIVRMTGFSQPKGAI
jgi:hypothetical protein